MSGISGHAVHCRGCRGGGALGPAPPPPPPPPPGPPRDRVRTRTRPERHETESEEENADCNSEETPHREPFPQRFSITREPSIRRGRLAHAQGRKPKAARPTFRLSDQIRPMRRSTRRTIRTMPRTPMPR
jgi:hypothetical protein